MSDGLVEGRRGVYRFCSGLGAAGLAVLACGLGLIAWLTVALGYDPCGLGDNECTQNTWTIAKGWISGGIAAAAALSAAASCVLGLAFALRNRGDRAFLIAVLATAWIIIALALVVILLPASATHCGGPGCDPVH